MDAKVVTAMTYQIRELEEASQAAKLAQRKSNIKAAVAVHKAAGPKRMVRFLFFLGFLP